MLKPPVLSDELASQKELALPLVADVQRLSLEPEVRELLGPCSIYHRGLCYTPMSHTIRNKTKLVKRVARIRGQLDAVVRALEEEVECGDVLRVIASARGAMDGLMAEVLEDHIRAHAFRNARPNTNDARAADELVDVMRSYLK